MSAANHPNGSACSSEDGCMGPRQRFRSFGLRGGDDDSCYTLYENWTRLGMDHTTARERLKRRYGGAS
jgi:hypothetical protein